MSRPLFNEIWSRILSHQGASFYTKRNLKFTYQIRGDIFFPSRTNWQIPKNDFRKTYEMVPIEGPGVINNLVQGPSYIWAVLHDPRISQDNW
ncbi:MAG TPA: hypothetical protein VMV49_13550 [Candidatus Deferrimicrobium sp.]|nr:hypothetical protein [Candidatus Deferrimicrobium sp.]